MEKIRKEYDECLKILRKNREICNFDVSRLEQVAALHLFGVKLREKYGLNIEPKRVNSFDFQRFGNNKIIALYGNKNNRKIAWPVDGRQPEEDEYLFELSFSIGPYMLSRAPEDYPKEFFQKFWLELKSYNPDYIDEANHSLYWKLENAKDIFNNYESILRKYQELNRKDKKRRQIEKMKKELKKLENSCEK